MQKGVHEMKGLKRFAGTIILAATIITVMIIGTAATAYADDATFDNYSEAQQYVYENVMDMNTEINYKVKVDSIGSEFTNYARNSILGLTEIDNGTSVAGDYAALNFYNGDSFSYSYQKVDGQYVVSVTDKVSYRLTKSQQNTYTKKLAKVMKKIGTSGSDSAKCSRIYNYSFSLPSTAYTSYAALVQKKAVCNGYAALVYDMCREAGVPCRMIVGTANGGLHAWNLIKVNGKWYNADSTWDAGNKTFKYFMKSDAQFPDHTRSAAYTTSSFKSLCPMASKSLKISRKAK